MMDEMNDNKKHKKIIPYKTSSGLEIGKFYEPKEMKEENEDMDFIQLAFIKNPEEDKKDFDLGMFVLYAATIILSLFLIYSLIRN